MKHLNNTTMGDALAMVTPSMQVHIGPSGLHGPVDTQLGILWAVCSREVGAVPFRLDGGGHPSFARVNGCAWPCLPSALMKCFLPEGDLLSPYLLLQSIKHLNDDQCQWVSCPAVDENMRDSSFQNKSASFYLFVFLMPHGPLFKCGLACSCILHRNGTIGTTRTPLNAVVLLALVLLPITRLPGCHNSVFGSGFR